MTMPDENNAGSDREAKPLGAEKAPGEDRDSLGATEGPADGIAGPAWPPADTEPDAQRPAPIPGRPGSRPTR